MSDVSFGWELFMHSVQDQFTSKADVLVAFIHFFLLKNGFKSIGIGDERTLSDTDAEIASELLPEGWNQMENIYKLRYLNAGKIYIVNALPSEGLLITNLLSGDNLQLSNVAFKIEDTVVDIKAPSKTIVKDFNAGVDKLKTEFLEPVYAGNKKVTSTQTVQPNRSRSPPPNRPLSPHSRGIPDSPYMPGFPAVGSGDLDPLGRLGPGNLFEPPRRPGFGIGGGFPGNFGPPGSRFDPFAPPGTGRRPGSGFEPNPDHERPPGYDDMFM